MKKFIFTVGFSCILVILIVSVTCPHFMYHVEC